MMTWVLVIVGYLLVGMAAAGFTLAVFPPQTGYRPPLRWLILAIASYIVLWPFLAMIGLGYGVGQWYKRSPSVGPRTVFGRGHRQKLYRVLYEETPN